MPISDTITSYPEPVDGDTGAPGPSRSPSPRVGPPEPGSASTIITRFTSHVYFLLKRARSSAPSSPTSHTAASVLLPELAPAPPSHSPRRPPRRFPRAFSSPQRLPFARRFPGFSRRISPALPHFGDYCCGLLRRAAAPRDHCRTRGSSGRASVRSLESSSRVYGLDLAVSAPRI
jgi:hypothetical protein